MEQKMLAKLYNQSSPGNQTRKVILRTLAKEEYILIIERHGMIWPKKLSREDSLTYTMGTRQLIIRNDSDEVVEKIKLGNIVKIVPEKPTDGKPAIRLTINTN